MPSLATVINSYALVSLAIPVVIGVVLYSAFTSADWENSTYTVIEDNGIITTKRTIG